MSRKKIAKGGDNDILKDISRAYKALSEIELGNTSSSRATSGRASSGRSATADQYQTRDRSSRETISTEIRIDSSKTESIIQPIDYKKKLIKDYITDKNIESFVDFESKATESFKDKHVCQKGNCKDINCIIPRQVMDLKEMVSNMDLKLFYINSGSTGHTFQAMILKRDEMGEIVKNNDGYNIFDNKMSFAFKVIAYPKLHYGIADNMDRPENVELRIIKLLSAMVLGGETPHLIIPVSVFKTSITPFLNTTTIFIDVNAKKNELYKEFIENYKNGKLEDHVSVLVSEWAEAGDLMNYIYDNYKKMSENVWKVILFQVIYTLARIHLRYPQFRHNDLKSNNVLLQKIQFVDSNSSHENKFLYAYRESKSAKIRYTFQVPNIGLQAKIWDYDFSCIGDLIKNSKVESAWARDEVKITSEKNQYYDLHYFINTISDREIYREFDKYVPLVIRNFISRIVPEKYHINTKTPNLTKNGRLAIFDEYTTPAIIIKTDPLFEDFRTLEDA